MAGRLLKVYPLFAKLLPGGYRAYRFAGGRIYLDIQESPMMLRRALGLFERDKIKAVRTFLKPGMTFADVGANKGDFSLIAARIVGDRGKVLAFEPEPENCAWIKKSIELNGYNNITLHEVALADSDGPAQLYLGEKSGWHTLLPSSQQRAISITKRRLDGLLEELGQTRIDVMKIDVEGAEMDVLRGAAETLVNNPQMVILMDMHRDHGVDPVEVADLLADQGFSVHGISAPYDKLPGDDVRSEILAKR